MSTIDILILLIGSGLIAFVYWFFLMKKDTRVSVEGEVTITVEGGYLPDTIQTKKGKELIIHFERKDPSSCLEEVVIPDFKIKKFLPLNERVTVVLTPEQEGEFPFMCGMSMYHGKIIVT